MGAFGYKTAMWNNSIVFLLFVSLKYISGMFWMFVAKNNFCVSRRILSVVRNPFLLLRLQMSPGDVTFYCILLKTHDFGKDILAMSDMQKMLLAWQSYF